MCFLIAMLDNNGDISRVKLLGQVRVSLISVDILTDSILNLKEHS